jgi:hypothetical protein
MYIMLHITHLCVSAAIAKFRRQTCGFKIQLYKLLMTYGNICICMNLIKRMPNKQLLLWRDD